jgi:hypothetical protein
MKSGNKKAEINFPFKTKTLFPVLAEVKAGEE